jgi:hypothetical protein
MTERDPFRNEAQPKIYPRPFLPLQKIILFTFWIEELAPPIPWYRRERNKKELIYNYSHKKPLSLSSRERNYYYTEHVEYFCPITKNTKIPKVSINDRCRCKLEINYPPHVFNSLKDAIKLRPHIVQIFLYVPWESAHIYVNNSDSIQLLKGINVICICLFKRIFDWFCKLYGNNNKYNLAISGGPAYQLPWNPVISSRSIISSLQL